MEPHVRYSFEAVGGKSPVGALSIKAEDVNLGLSRADVRQYAHGVDTAGLGPVPNVVGRALRIIHTTGELLHGPRRRELYFRHNQRYKLFNKLKRLETNFLCLFKEKENKWLVNA